MVAGDKMKDMDLRAGFEFDIRVGTPRSDGFIFDPGKDMFELLANGYGLKPTDYGREFSTGRETFRIVGIEPRRPKYPINVERMPDRTGFKFTAENIAIYLKAAKQ